MAYVAVNIEGGFFPADLLDRIATEDEKGQNPKDFGLDSARLTDTVQGAFSDTRSYWDAFQRRLQNSRESATTLTREAWIRPFMELLGFELVYQQRATEVGGSTYAISHRAGEDPLAPPVHIVALGQALDKKAEGSKRSPHALVQEYLNRSDALWGVVTDGRTLRLLRDSARVAHPAYMEFDLQALIEGNLYNEFVLLYRLTHRSRFPRGAEDAHECWLERYYQQGLDEGGRVREHLRDGVEAALKQLGTAFLAHPDSDELREKLRSGLLDEVGYYRQLLRLVYRLLFLLVAEDRKLLLSASAENAERHSVYNRYYSLARLRERCDRPFATDLDSDLWQGLKQTMLLFRDDYAARQLGLTALDGELFGEGACADLEGAGCENRYLLAALYHFTTFTDKSVRRRVNFGALDVEELGSVYESLLDFHPFVDLDGMGKFDLLTGSERKQTGSYYTPPELVHELINSALVPVMEERLASAKTPEEKERALLGLRVCDPAAGSGHFLLAAARRIARTLAQVRTGEDEATPDAYRRALRDVIRHCIYAVDKNPLAVDLCKVALWIEGYNAGLPLSFLDHHIKPGDSLVGTTRELMEKGVPVEAFEPVSGDDKKVASALKKRNRREYLEIPLPQVTALESVEDVHRYFAALEEDDDSVIEDAYNQRRRSKDFRRKRLMADLWTAAFFWPLGSGQPEPPTHGYWQQLGSDPFLQDYVIRGKQDIHLHQPACKTVRMARALANANAFFHWDLEFPEVFANGGFDVMLGNPPWERIKLQEKEFFAARDPEIAEAPNKAARQALIKTLPERRPKLARDFALAIHAAEAQSKFVRTSGRFPMCGRGDVNTYSIFAESFLNLQNPTGRVGCIVPSGIATDDTTKFFFQYLMDTRRLARLYEFENEGFFGVGQGHMVRFALVTLLGNYQRAPQADFLFQGKSLEELKDCDRHFPLTAEDLVLVNPNTRTCPIFRTRRDAEITKAIYRRVPVLTKENDEVGNQWGVTFMTMFHMANDSGLFHSRKELENDGWTLEGNVFYRTGNRYLPLYEAKMFSHYNHRLGDFNLLRLGSGGHVLPIPPTTLLQRNDYVPLPRYWVPELEVRHRLRGKWDQGWLFGWRNVTDARASARTVIFSIIPWGGVGHGCPLMMPDRSNIELTAMLQANLSAYVLDYVARQKVGGVNLTYGYLKQFPVLPPSTFKRPSQWHHDRPLVEWLLPRVLELTFTASDLQPFAQDMGYHGPPFRWDEDRRFLLRCELDAAYFHLYEIARDDVGYIMDTFRIVRERDVARFGEYRTKRLILEIYDEMQRAMQTKVPYETRLDPPPADSRVAHAEDLIAGLVAE